MVVVKKKRKEKKMIVFTTNGTVMIIDNIVGISSTNKTVNRFQNFVVVGQAKIDRNLY